MDAYFVFGALFLAGLVLATNFRGFTTWYARKSVRPSPGGLFLSHWTRPSGPRELERRRSEALAMFRLIGGVVAGLGLAMLFAASPLGHG
ncbi:hypothetical protein ACQP00_44800 [Dactylosporangium sp. CS-047395]|uniref:hypothetical protein n=1 Tax=Dactylosporangium sp. CS-047395 TaxID=3239936 RepID=UPI003D943BB8